MNFQVEFLNRCDLSCVECPTRLIQRTAASMKDDVWRTILHKYIVPYWRVNDHLNPPTFIPHKDCEPLLHNKLTQRLRDVADAVPMNIDIYTHGLHLPTMPEFLPFLGTLPNKVRLLVSFHFHNHDGTINDYTQTSAYLREIIRKARPANVEIILASHLVTPMTRERLDEWRESWKEEMSMGVAVHANVAINSWTGLIEGTEHAPGCPYERFDHVFFGVTGNILACCMDLEEEITFGNVMTADPEEVMGTLGAFYAAQRRHEVNHTICNVCFGRPRELVQVGGIS